MPAGKSGGRSAGNRGTAPRRATHREREGIDPPGRDEWERLQIQEDTEGWVLTRRGKQVVGVAQALVTLLCLSSLGTVIGLLLGRMFGLI